MKRIGTSIMTVAALAIAAPAFGQDVSDTVTPNDLAPSADFSEPHRSGDEPYGWDWDSAKPESAAGAPDGWGDSSFYANVERWTSDSGDPYPGAANLYRTVRIAPHAALGLEAPITVGQLSNFSYFTNGPDDGVGDWRPTIYTVAGSGDTDGTGWYGSRLQALPGDADNIDLTAGDWDQWTTESGSDNQLKFYDSSRGFGNADLSWSDIISGEVTVNDQTWDFSDEEIMMIDFTLGANDGGWDVASQLDGLEFTTTGDATLAVDLAAVPEPTSGLLFGLAGLAAMRRRRRRA